MSTYRIKAQCSDIVKLVGSWAEDQNWVLKRLDRNDLKKAKNGHVIINGKSAKDQGYEAIWKIVAGGKEECLVKLETILTLRKLAIFFFLTIGILVAAYICIHSLVNIPFPFDQIRAPGTTVMFFVGSLCLAVIWALRTYDLYKDRYKKLRTVEVLFDDYLNDKFQCQIVSGIDPLVVPRKIYIIGVCTCLR